MLQVARTCKSAVAATAMNATGNGCGSPGAKRSARRDRTAAVSVIKPQVDRKSYRYICLENGLKAVAVHDPEMREMQTRSQQAVADGSGSSEEEEEEGDEDIDEDDDENIDEDDDEEIGEEDDEDGANGEDGEAEFEEDGRNVVSSAARGSSVKPRTKKAAAAMCVNTGSLSDSPEMQGLAHFLEHMLFMGSKKYPVENEFDAFLTDHGGSSNAFTEAETTTFYFNVNHEFLDGALDRFAQFFIAPLVPDDCLQREVQSVESEFRQAMNDDTARLMQLQSYTAPAGHPMSQFAWGNAKSLSEIPLSRGVNQRDMLFKLYNDNYAAERMFLCVVGSESLDELEEMIESKFRFVRSSSHEGISAPPSNPYAHLVAQYGNSMIRSGSTFWVESVKDQRLLNLSWSLPCLDHHYLKKPSEYLSHLIGHEGKNSLLSSLKDRQWAMELCAGVGESSHDKNSLSYLFSVQISLTKLGLQEWEKVVAAAFCYLSMLKSASPQEWVYEELRDIFNMQFRFLEEEEFDEYAVNLANNLRLVDPRHAINKDHIFEEFDPSLIEECLNLLSPERLRIDICTKETSIPMPKYQLQEEWFGIQYSEMPFSQSQQDLWELAYKSSPDALQELSGLSLGFPPRNLYIPTDFSMVHAPACEDPVIAYQNPRMRLWHKISVSYNAPKASLFVSIYAPSFTVSVRAAVLGEVFVKLLQDSLNETLYMASVADIEASISFLVDRIEVNVAGFSHKIVDILEAIFSSMFDLRIREGRVQVITEDLQRKYGNIGLKPLSQASLSRLHLLRAQSYHAHEKYLSLMAPVSLSEMISASQKFSEDLRIEALFVGNISVERSLAFCEFLVKHSKLASNGDVERVPLRPEKQVLKLSCGITELSLPSKNAKEDNNAVEEYYQILPGSTREKAMVDLLESLMSEPLFNELRTKQQLGYTVDCSARNTYGLFGFIIRVQSSSKSPSYLAGAVEDFVAGKFLSYLQGMSHSQFLEHRQSLQASKRQKDLCLVDEASRLWEEVWEGRYSFDARIEEAYALEEITKDDIVQLVKTFLIKSGKGYRHLSTRVFTKSDWEGLGKAREESDPHSGLMALRTSLHSQLPFWPNLLEKIKL